jgi:hypothetical protein
VPGRPSSAPPRTIARRSAAHAATWSSGFSSPRTTRSVIV